MMGGSGTKGAGGNGAGGVAHKPLSKSSDGGPAAAAGAKRDYYSHPVLANHLARRVAVDADCDPRAVFKYLWGGPQHPLLRERIERSLLKNGHEALVGYASKPKPINARISGKG